MKQRWTFRCYPSPEQEQILARTFGCCRFVYNWALEQRTTAFKTGGRMTYALSSAALTKLKRDNWRTSYDRASDMRRAGLVRPAQRGISDETKDH